MNGIGGFFELEIGIGKNLYHETAYVLSTARACLNTIIKTMKPAKIYVPYYTCNALIQPIISNKIDYEFYKINNNLEPIQEFSLNNNEYLIYVNYFGLKTEAVKQLFLKYKESLIIDNTQAFFDKNISGAFSFNSARKFFGVSDGAYLYSPVNLEIGLIKRNEDFHFNHLINRLIGRQELAYKEFRVYEESLSDDIKRISIFSESILSNVDYQNVRQRRRDNFNHYHLALQNKNLLNLDFQPESVPFAYPLMVKKKINKELLFKQNIFIPTLWKDTLERNGSENYSFEKELTENVLPLPVDQRYGEAEIQKVINAVSELI